MKDNPLLLFIDMMDMFMDEMLRREGPGDSLQNPVCLRCKEKVGTSERKMVTCEDCRSGSLWCDECVVKDHGRLYLHRVKVRISCCLDGVVD